jgi:hypothetical protein
VDAQFNTGNDFFHPVKGGIGTGKPGLNATSLLSPWNSNIGTQTMTCFDCHQTNAHGSDNQRMLISAFDIDGILDADAGDDSSLLPDQGAAIESFCTNCHNSDVYSNGSITNASVFEYHGTRQNQHSSTPGNNALGCLGCHAGIFTGRAGKGGCDVQMPNGAATGNTHGGSYTWPNDACSDTPNLATDNFMLGGWLNGWGPSGNCAGGECNHNGGKSYTTGLD